jgi:hypothetical protein
MFVEFRRGFSTEDKEVIAKEGLNTRKAKVCEARAVIQKSVDPLYLLIRLMYAWRQVRELTARVRLVQ